MITGEYWKLHDDEALRKLDAAAVRLLSEGGVRVHHDGLLDMLEGAGCHVSRNGSRCFIPERLVRSVLEHFGGGPAERAEFPVGFNPQHLLSHSGSHPHLLEWPSGRRRLATVQDARDMAKMAHVLPEFGRVGKVLTCNEISQRIEPLWAVLEIAQITDKPIGGSEVFHADHLEPLVRMAEVLSGRLGDTSLIPSGDFFIAPLILDRKQAECFLEKRRLGVANTPGTMPISGMSTPVTIAGTAAVGLAELIAGWVLCYVVRPDLPAGGAIASGSLDMQTATARFGSPEALLQDAAIHQTCRRLYGIPCWVASNYVDAKTPGFEAAFQKMLPLVCLPLGCWSGVGGDGLLSAGQDYSPVQHLLEADMGKTVARFLGSFEISDETLAVPLIQEMMAGEATNFLDTDHTARHYREEQWYPRWLDRTLWRGDEAERDAEHRTMERIDRHCRDAIASYEPPDVDAARIRELRRIYEAFEKSL